MLIWRFMMPICWCWWPSLPFVTSSSKIPIYTQNSRFLQWIISARYCKFLLQSCYCNYRHRSLLIPVLTIFYFSERTDHSLSFYFILTSALKSCSFFYGMVLGSSKSFKLLPARSLLVRCRGFLKNNKWVYHQYTPLNFAKEKHKQP